MKKEGYIKDLQKFYQFEWLNKRQCNENDCIVFISINNLIAYDCQLYMLYILYYTLSNLNSKWNYLIKVYLWIYF